MTLRIQKEHSFLLFVSWVSAVNPHHMIFTVSLLKGSRKRNCAAGSGSLSFISGFVTPQFRDTVVMLRSGVDDVPIYYCYTLGLGISFFFKSYIYETHFSLIYETIIKVHMICELYSKTSETIWWNCLKNSSQIYFYRMEKSILEILLDISFVPKKKEKKILEQYKGKWYNFWIKTIGVNAVLRDTIKWH